MSSFQHADGQHQRGGDDTRRLGGHQCLLVKQFQPSAQPDIEVNGLAVEAFGGLLRLLAGLLFLGGDRGVQAAAGRVLLPAVW